MIAAPDFRPPCIFDNNVCVIGRSQCARVKVARRAAREQPTLSNSDIILTPGLNFTEILKIGGGLNV